MKKIPACCAIFLLIGASPGHGHPALLSPDPPVSFSEQSEFGDFSFLRPLERPDAAAEIVRPVDTPGESPDTKKPDSNNTFDRLRQMLISDQHALVQIPPLQLDNDKSPQEALSKAIDQLIGALTIQHQSPSAGG